MKTDAQWDEVIKTAEEMAAMAKESDEWYRNNPQYQEVKP